MISLLFGLETYADTEADLVFKTNVPKAVAIKKLGMGSPVYADPQTGNIQGTLRSVLNWILTIPKIQMNLLLQQR